MIVSQPSGENIDKKCRDLSPVLLPDFEKGDWLRPRCLSPFSKSSSVPAPHLLPKTLSPDPAPPLYSVQTLGVGGATFLKIGYWFESVIRSEAILQSEVFFLSR
jgi:hypothetical protein